MFLKLITHHLNTSCAIWFPIPKFHSGPTHFHLGVLFCSVLFCTYVLCDFCWLFTPEDVDLAAGPFRFPLRLCCSFSHQSNSYYSTHFFDNSSQPLLIQYLNHSINIQISQPTLWSKKKYRLVHSVWNARKNKANENGSSDKFLLSDTTILPSR